jgi:hypothetical protein
MRNVPMRNAECGMRNTKDRIQNSRSFNHSSIPLFRNPQSAFRILVFAFAAAAVALATGVAAQSLSYTKGQNVAPAYEGWEQDANGTK